MTPEMPIEEKMFRISVSIAVPCGRGQRHEDEPDAEALDDADRDDRMRRGLVGEIFHLVERTRQQHESRQDQPARFDEAQQPPDQEHAHQRPDATASEQPAGGSDGVAKDVLHERARERHGAEQRHADEGQKRRPLTKLRSRKIANRTNGLSVVKECTSQEPKRG
jgi:hypothetical protein